MSCSESANVLSGVAFILRTSSGPAFPADHTAIDTAHPKVVDRNNQASDGRMTAFCGALGSARPTNGSYRRILPVPAHSRGGRLTERTPAVQPSQPERVKVPHCRR